MKKTVKEVIEFLERFDENAEVSVIAHCKEYPFTFSWNTTDGDSEEEVDLKFDGQPSFYVDDLCTKDDKTN